MTLARLQPQPMAQHGFSMVEMAVVLVLLGLLGWGVSGAYENAGTLRERDLASRTGEALQQALRAFVLANARLPCPDLSGSGWEGDTSGNCPAGTEAGWLPYRALGLDLPPPLLKAGYSVYRNAAAPAGNADLAVRQERTGDSAGSQNYQNVNDFIVGLNWAQAAGLQTGHTRLTGNGGADGAIDCTANVRSNPAYWLVVPLQDRDNNGDRFDSVHQLGFNCAYAPGTALNLNWDDVVLADSPAALAGWLAANTP